MRWLLLLCLLVAPAFGAGDFSTAESSVDITDSASLDLSTAHTFMGWVKESADSKWRILANRQTGATSRMLFIAVTTPDEIQANASSGGVSSAGYVVESTSTPGDGTWHHFAVAFSSATDARIYIDGAHEATDSSVAAVDVPNADLIIGRSISAGYSLAGEVDDFRLYDRKLSPEEIADIYASAGCDGIVDGLLSRVTMAEGAVGSTISSPKDTGPAGLALTVTSTPKWSASERLSCLR